MHAESPLPGCGGTAALGPVGSLAWEGEGSPPPHARWFSWASRRGLCCCGMVGLSVSVFLVFPMVCRLAWWCVVGWLRVLASFLFPVFGGDEVEAVGDVAERFESDEFALAGE